MMTPEPSDAQLAEMVAKMRRIRRRNRLAHAAAGCALVVSSIGVWSVYASIFDVTSPQSTGRIGMLLACGAGMIATHLVYTRLSSKERMDEDG